MEWLVVIALGVALYQLHQRVIRLEARLDEREWQPPYQSAATPVERSAPTAPVQSPVAVSEPVSGPEPEPIGAEPIAPMPLASPEETLTVALSEPEPHSDMPDAEIESEPASAFSGFRFDFEDIFGRRLPIWAGGVALAVAGIFLVLYAIEAGLLTPFVRVALSFAFGLLLLCGAEAAFRFEHRIADPRVRQALAGAGLATLYAAFYLAGTSYGLIGPAAAFGGLAAVTALAIGLSFRFGMPAAVLGLIGGFATPMMVASEQANVPILAFYLALLTAGLVFGARRQGQAWIGSAALVGGFVWGVLMLLGEPSTTTDLLASGIYLLALGAIVPLLAGETGLLRYSRLAAGALASVQLALLVNLAGYDLVTWGLYLLLAAALAVLAWRVPALRPGNMLAAALGVILLGFWPEPAAVDFAIVAAGLALVAVGVPLALVWRDRAASADLAQLTVAALALAGVSYWQYGSGDNTMFEPELAAVMAALALPAGLASLRLWRGGPLAAWLALPLAAASALAFYALVLLLPYWADVAGATLVTLMLAEFLRRRSGSKALAGLAWVGALVALLMLVTTGDIFDELSRLVGEGDGRTDTLRALARWALAALPLLALVLLEWRRRASRCAEALFALIIYGFAAQVIGGDWLPITLAVAAAAAAFWLRARSGLWWALLAIGACWALPSFGQWCGEGVLALSGEPMLASDLPDWQSMLRNVASFALAAGFVSWRTAERARIAILLAIAAGATGTAVVHVLYKQVFGLAALADFLALGMAERTIWQALLVGGGVLLAHLAKLRRIEQTGHVLIALGLAHFAIFTFGLHNPLWDAQAVGRMPIANWLVPAYAIAAIAVWWLVRRTQLASLAQVQAQVQVLGDAVTMVLLAMLALSELRQAFAGSIMVSPPLSQTEDLLRSLLGIVLALGFLAWGSRRDERSWRIGSLVLMLMAVIKVFLVDAAGLEGLLRIASFLALGFSLIGIGWVYSRQLSRREAQPETNPESQPETGP